MNNYFHLLGKLGVYNIKDKQIMLDFRGMVEDEYMPRFTLMHESVHTVLAVETDFAQATHLLYKLQNEFLYSEEDKRNIFGLMYQSQYFVQEGFATIIPFALLKNDIGKQKADEWATSHITGDYSNFLQKLYFLTDLSLEKRNLFYSKIAALVMELGFRVLAPKYDLLQSATKVQEFLDKEDNNPNKRFEKLIAAVKNNPDILDLTIPDIAQKTNLPYLPASKKDVATFMTYLLGKTKHPAEYKEEYVQDRPEGSATLNDAFNNMTVANINIDLAETSEIIFDYKDFLFMSDKIEVIFVNTVDEHTTDMDFLRPRSVENPEVAIVGFTPNRQNYITYVTRMTAEKIINNQLKCITFAVKFGDFDIIRQKLFWSDTVRHPDLIIYNTPSQMKLTLDRLLTSNPQSDFTHLHAQFMENNPIQMLFVALNGDNAIHAVNHFGNKGISEVLQVIKQKSKVMDKDYLLKNKKTINNYLALWGGLWWEVDWTENMFDKTHLFFRDGKVLSV